MTEFMRAKLNGNRVAEFHPRRLNLGGTVLDDHSRSLASKLIGEDYMKKIPERMKPGAYLVTLCIFLFVVANPSAAQQVQKSTINRVKTLLKEGKPALGVVLTMPSPPAAEILARAGFDWMWIDLEHSPIDLETADRMIQAMQGMETVPFVRVAWNRHWGAERQL